MTWTDDAERATYWHTEYAKERQKRRSAVAEAKKAKERQLAATRLALKYKKQFDEVLAMSEMPQRFILPMESAGWL
jgi:hypothetical protein